MRGATRKRYVGSFVQSLNPRTYARCDVSALSMNPISQEFKSTHLCEVRPSMLLRLLTSRLFKSTHLCEVRRVMYVGEEHFYKFKSTHLCEVRRWENNYSEAYDLFKSTHLCEVRHSVQVLP